VKGHKLKFTNDSLLIGTIYQGRWQKNFEEGGQWKNQGREIAQISLPLLYQWRVRGRWVTVLHLGLTSR